MTHQAKRREIAVSESHADFQDQLLLWTQRFTAVSFLTSNMYAFPGPPPHTYQNLVACDAVEELDYCPNYISELSNFHQRNRDWIFGHLSYDLKNQLEELPERSDDRVGFSKARFFVPRHLFIRKNSQWLYLPHASVANPEQVLKDIVHTEVVDSMISPVHLKMRTSKAGYLRAFETVRKRLQRGDIYEMNLCQEFYAENTVVDPVSVFRKVNAYAETPFSAFYRNDERFLLCASPERYLSVQGSEVLSQPIKGTAKRHPDQQMDKAEFERLKNDPKERSENVMIVDLVRNDLSRNATRGSVHVPELFGVYSFKSVHQLISTVRAELPSDKTVFDVTRSSFPMGSMTGAPKISAMKVIDEVEDFQRGLYSGSVGYVDPDGNADFNVVIRSLLYHRTTGYLSLPVGGAITIQANAEQEYDECLLKAEAIRNLLGGDSYL